MAIRLCRECGHQVSTDAASCPSCGVTAPTDEAQARLKKTLTGQGAVFAVALLVVLALGGLLLANWWQDRADAERDGARSSCYLTGLAEGLEQGSPAHDAAVDRCLANLD